MPPRRKPTSTKLKKAEQQLKRAIKRGDVPPPEPKKHPRHRKSRVGPTGHHIGPTKDPVDADAAKRLQSAFVKVSPKFLEESKFLASTLPLPRPVPSESAIFQASDRGEVLSCPRRPKWRYDMTKLEVEHNEEGLFKKWLAESDQMVEHWQKQRDIQPPNPDESTPTPRMPASPTYFERNLEVWRQLWRVSEISQILLILLDSRCPILHFPPSLSAYLEKQKIILILTKVDITGPIRVDAWKSFLHTKYPGIPIVEVESYVEKDATAVHQGKKLFEPSIPETFRKRLIDAIKHMHTEMLEPPAKVKANTSWLKEWTPPVKPDINWADLLEAKGENVGVAVGSAGIPQVTNNSEGGSEDIGPETSTRAPDFLTIGLIGQPNVGKSSLLNALFGARRVRASKTPGKTKHFQTLFWTTDVRLVDCPGLVMPNFVPMEMQVLLGILPISRVSAIPSCIHFAAQLLPLERIFGLTHPGSSEPAVPDKRTWREGMRPDGDAKVNQQPWTAMDILTAYATSKGWLTAKAGRPDVHRAGNAILRALAEGRVSWGFWPPASFPAIDPGSGIWIPESHNAFESEGQSEYGDSDGEHSEDDASDIDQALQEDDSDGSRDSGVESGLNVGIGRFGALALQEEQESESSEE